MIESLCLAGALAFALGSLVYDVTMSVKGITAGVAVEANYVWLYGTDKPSALRYYLVNIPMIFASAGISVAGLHSALFYAGLAAPCVAGIVHIKGGLAWKKLGIKWW
jgi:hypothetical protein